MKRLLPALLSASVLCLLGGLSGCGSEPPKLPADPAGLLADVAGHLDTQTTFRLTMDTAVPKSAPASDPATADPTATQPTATGPTAAATPRPAGPQAQYTVSLTGMWSTTTHQGDMAGQLNGVTSTVLAANGVEYVSLTPPQGGKTWLKVDGGGLFGLFDDPHLVGQLLRAYHGVDLAAGARHVSGTIVTAEADTHIADPNLLGALAALPDTVAFDVTADPTGAPTKIVFRLTGDSARTSGTVELRDFGAKAADFAVPTADQVVEAPRSGG